MEDSNNVQRASGTGRRRRGRVGRRVGTGIVSDGEIRN